MDIEDSQIIARFQCLLTESLVAKRWGQWRPELKDALYQMLFKELEQRDLKKTPEYRNVMLRADQHAEWLARLARLSSPDPGLPVSSTETERTDTLTAPKKAGVAIAARCAPFARRATTRPPWISSGSHASAGSGSPS